MISTETTELAKLLHQLREADKNLRVFGANSHHYDLLPPLAEAELLEFEQANGITLPEDYRFFLREIGNGGAGPFYGLEPLEVAAQYRDLSKPFPFTTDTVSCSDEELNKCGDRDEYPGILEFCSHGCAIYSYLVVNGPTYGTIWDGREDFYPSGMSFTVWYRQWAETALRLLENEPLVDKLSVGMTKEQVLSATGGNWSERKNLYSPEYYFEAPDIPAQLILSGKNGIVTKINRSPFI